MVVVVRLLFSALLSLEEAAVARLFCFFLPSNFVKKVDWCLRAETTSRWYYYYLSQMRGVRKKENGGWFGLVPCSSLSV